MLDRQNNILIIGAGLMGASLALALKNTNRFKIINAVVKDKTEQQKARKLECFNNVFTSITKKNICAADLIIVATPVSIIPEIINKIYPLTKKECIITDLGSVKYSILQKIKTEYRYKYVGSHPMTGSEKNGIDFADAALYENAVVILTKEKKTDLQRLDILCEFWKLLKCNVKIIDAEFHDLIVGYISHLPHITAAALVNTAALQKKNCVEPLSFAGGGFRDTTRIAASNAELWADILVNNKKVINQAIADMIENLKQFQNALDKNNKDKLIDIFQSAKTNREAIPQHLKDLISITYELIVNVPDKPGILGKLTTLLGDNNINIKHIEVLFVRDDERGAIKLGFKDAETATKGYKLLLANNYIVSKK